MIGSTRGPRALGCAALVALCASSARADRDVGATSVAGPECTHADPLRQPFFGDLHVHTAYSLDAASTGSPRAAYAHARSAKRPLDFVAVTDHAEWLGEVRVCTDPEDPAYRSDVCWAYREQRNPTIGLISERTIRHRERFAFCGERGRDCDRATRSVWQDTRAAAEAFDDPTKACAFTTFVAYEWTGTPGPGINLHRNVIFANAIVPDAPTSALDADSPAALWAALESQCLDARPGCDVLTIPHNPNLSAGTMFASAKLARPEDAARPIDRDEARARRRFEPLVEIMQHKGDSECLPGGEAPDPACAFEKVPYDSFRGAMTGPEGWPGMPPRRSDTLREALKRGLALEAELGVNPFAYGIVASTDTHAATPGAVDEDGYAGHTITNTGPTRGALPDVLQYNPGGLAVVWAEENSRSSIFRALRRRETYGTSGPRIVARFFGGWDLPEDLCGSAELVSRADATGVPMGGTLPARPPRGPGGPAFVVTAMQDAGAADRPGTALREVQIVKGWVEAGALREKVVSIARADGEASVDLETCEPKGQGAASLCGVWTDPEFSAEEPAFYYARVLENPTCRWSRRVCNARGVVCARPETIGPGLAPCCDARHQPVVSQRAWPSPIWYAPDESRTRRGRRAP